MATIEKRIQENGATKFRARVRMRGAPEANATFTSSGDAKRWAAQTETAIHQQKYFKIVEGQRRTLTDLISRYQKEVLPFKSENYKFLKSQHKQLEWWKQQLGCYLLSDIGPSRIVKARATLNASPSTMNRYMAILSHVFTIGSREWEWLEVSPISKIKKLREPRGRVRYLSNEERSALLQRAKESGDTALYLVIILALSTGARKGELLNLRWQDVDLARGRLVFQHTKNGERRAAPLGEYALAVLKGYRAERLMDSLVFPNSRGSSLRVDRGFRRLLAEAGIEDFRFHDLRHSAASYLAMSGASMTDIAEVLGHKTLAMVKRYTHLSDSHTAKVVARMNSNIFSHS